jgi:leader peptidase (prepilin peptidase) / N-methyltransferase
MLARTLQKIAPGFTASSLSSLDIRASAVIIAVAVAAAATSIAVAPDARGIVAAGLAFIMVTVAIVDARQFIIPDELTAAAFALGLVHAALEGADDAIEPIAFAVLRAVVLGLVFLALRTTYRWLRGRQGIGLGDVKLAAVAGAWLDWPMMPIAVEIAAVVALGCYLARQIAFGRSIRSTGRLPFGLFFAPAIWLGWLIQAMPLTRLAVASF